ncbi:hypothetical protein ACFSBZ_16410 [Amnibacterium flavum]|uniref:hypothetical protein n=1 Tax=Amnibacterium flavum TaxID=2173173 RepID=UPI0010581B6F|nr:hypothetical protein [Amnibacterium flavum]
MADETDGVNEAFDDSLRVALTVAAQLGERVARLREELARQREATAIQEGRELQARFDAERAAARAQLTVVNQPAWWDNARVEDIAAVHETATSWSDHDAAAEEARATIRREIQHRYGVDATQPGANPDLLAEALHRAETDHAGAGGEREPAGQGRSDTRSQALGYDSAERRDRFAHSLEGTATAEEIQGRVLADLGNAKPPREALRPVSDPTPSALRSVRGLGKTRDSERTR